MASYAELRGHGPSHAEWQLIEAVVAGDGAATDCFCRRYEPVLRRYFEMRWHGSPLQALVADAVQEAVFECLRPGGALLGLDRARCPGIEAYLHGVARNVAGRVERREARYAARCRRGGDGIAAFAAPEPEPPERLGRRLLSDVVREAVARLDAQPAIPGHSMGELIRLHFREGMPVREIAARWHESAEHVHELRRRACRRLRRLLSGAGLACVRHGA